MKSVPKRWIAADKWAFQAHTHIDSDAPFEVRPSEVIFSDVSAYLQPWGKVSQCPLKTIRVQEVNALEVKFVLYELENGQLVRLSTKTLSRSAFIEFLQTGQIAGVE